ncbi:lachesin-like [Limulus polyphemus]|uniref:Lachesin-like n=1 Tax=Limulus polyphemus TaxID=6850 RepID=A0ABM1BR46_LIMPO|nr:lachesin-like [Limulus polyphemus]
MSIQGGILCMFVFLFHSVVAQQTPAISYITEERVVNIGDNVDLQCSVEYASNYPVLWTKINREKPSEDLFISKDSSLIVPDPRYSIRHDKGSRTYTLQISKIQEIDAGPYQCQVIIGPTSKITADVLMSVKIPPVILDNSTHSIVTSNGATVSLNCYASGLPTPRISWRRENNDLLPTGGAVYRGNVLTIHDITRDDRGTYYCIANNKVGRGARRNVGVEVEFAPVVMTDRPRYGQALKYDMDFQCHVEAFPSPSIIWIKDGFQLNDNQHYRISIFATADEFTDSILRVKTIEKNQYGNYTCKAVNKLGSDQKDIQLVETTNIICPPACGIGLISGAENKKTAFLLAIFMAIFDLMFAKQKLSCSLILAKLY